MSKFGRPPPGSYGGPREVIEALLRTEPPAAIQAPQSNPENSIKCKSYLVIKPEIQDASRNTDS